MNEASQKRLSHALEMAVRLHANQLRKGSSIPYVAHLLSVAGIAMEYGANEDETIAALLHDAVEDAGGKPTLELIRTEFGDNVAEIVDGCTDADVIPKPPWKERKLKYIAHLVHASAPVRLVCASDKLHNARSVLSELRKSNGAEVWSKFKGGRDGTLWYYRAVLTELLKHERSPLNEELERVVGELERLAALK